jgi:hypothetical protein
MPVLLESQSNISTVPHPTRPLDQIAVLQHRAIGNATTLLPHLVDVITTAVYAAREVLIRFLIHVRNHLRVAKIKSYENLLSDVRVVDRAASSAHRPLR